jgi:PKD repeat protein
MQMCIRGKEASSTGMTVGQQNDVADVIGEIQRRTGGVPVYISPLNVYVENDCAATGPYGVPNAIELADWASATGLATRGPDTGPLDHSQLANDLCHLNDTGLVAVGEPMVDFFDVMDIPDEPPVADFTYSPARPRVNEQITFQDLSTDDGTIVSWTWSFDGVQQTGQQAQIKFLQSGPHEVTLTVTDDNNNVAATTKLVTVRTVTNR